MGEGAHVSLEGLKLNRKGRNSNESKEEAGSSEVMRALWTSPCWPQVSGSRDRGGSWEVGWGSGPEGTSGMRGGLEFALWSKSHFQSHLIGLVFRKISLEP